MSHQTLYYLITKALEEELSLNKINREMKLICDECQEEEWYPLESFFQNPISAILWYNNAPKCSSEWTKKSIQEEITTRLSRSKQALQSYLEQVQSTIKNYCASILREYSTIVDNVIAKSSNSLQNLQRLNQIYSSQLQQQINGNDLSLQFLNTVVQGFLTGNGDPSGEFSSQTRQIISILQKFPYLQTQKLTRYYEQLCDPLKWKLSNFIQNSVENEIFQNVDSVHLADKKHYLRYGSEGIAVFSYQSQTPIAIYGQNSIDQCSEINGFKIYGYNEDQILIFSYINPRQLEIINRVAVKFPTELSYEQPFIYYKSQNNQWRWNLASQPELLSKPTFSQFLKPKQSKEPVQFNFQDNFVTLS